MGAHIGVCRRRRSDLDINVTNGHSASFSGQWAIGDLRKTVLNLLVSGGDERLLIDPATGLNKYNIPIEPIDIDEAIVRSSSTANPVTLDDLKYADGMIKDLMEEVDSGVSEGEVFTNMLHLLRLELRKEWRLDEDDISVTLVSSGTDAELLPIMFGVLRAQRAREEEDEQCDVLTILTAAGELGTNTVMAATGKVCGDILPVQQLRDLRDSEDAPSTPRSHSRSNPFHFITKKLTMSGKPEQVESEQHVKGDNIFPLFGSIAAIEVPLRDEITGALVTPDFMDNKVTHIVTTACASGQYKAVLLHMVIACKTGHCVPSVNCVQRLVAQFPEVVPVVDACQMRGLTALSIRRLIKLDFIVMCTGSKFYGGPAFSGGVIFPAKFAAELKAHLSESAACRSCITNSLLSGYFCATTVSKNFPELRALLPESPNFGLALRWSLALRNITRYHNISEATREEIILSWVTGVRKMIRDNQSGLIELLDKTADQNVVDGESLENQVYSMGLPRTGSHSMAEAMKLLGMCGMNRCMLTLSRVKHVTPEGQRVIGNFEVDNSLFRNYKQIFDEKPLAKFILTTRDAQSYKTSIERWNEKNQDRTDISDIPQSTSDFENEVTEFFVHRRAAHRLLVVDVFKMPDEELWTKLMDFVSPVNSHGADRFDPIAAKIPFPRAVVQVAGNLTHGNESQVVKEAGDGTSANDLELLTGQVNTIIPITLKKKVLKKKGSSFERLHLEELKRLHLLLALDCSRFTPQITDVSSEQNLVLAKRCFIAQPVSLNLTTWGRAAYLGVLRISLGAVSIIDAVEKKKGPEGLLEQDRVVLLKLDLLLQHWETTMKWNVRGPYME